MIKIIIFIFINILINVNYSFADGAPEPFVGFRPRFYEGSYQEGRNLCLGVAIAADSYPGLRDAFDSERTELPSEKITDFFDDKKFDVLDAIADVAVEYKDYNGFGSDIVFLFLVIDPCIVDKTSLFVYTLRTAGGDGITDFKIGYKQTDEKCGSVTAKTCSAMDLDAFHAWADTLWDMTDSPLGDDEDNDDHGDDETDDDDGRCGGCASSSGGFSFPLVLGMFLIGLFAWGVARKRSGRRQCQPFWKRTIIEKTFLL